MTTTDVSSEFEFKPGSFELPIMIDSGGGLNNIPVTQGRSGASVTHWESHEEPDANGAGHDVLSAHADFPMIVWLRGDEPWFSQFDMDADTTMAALGIKRSRLTQISGRDLRVGRVRMDRYIRPVYRSLDVEQYLNQTRATASHQKSSDAIKQAMEQLSEQSNRMLATIDTIGSNFSAQINGVICELVTDSVNKALEPLTQQIGTLPVELHSQITTSFHEIQQRVDHSIAELANTLTTAATAMQSSAREQAAALEILTLQLNQTSEKTALMEERLAAWDKMLTQNLQNIALDLAELKKPSPFRKSTSRKPAKIQVAQPASTKLTLATRAAPNRRKPK
jgi:hypothetical protein